MTKDALMSRVWGPVAVGDNTLHVHITALRKALGDGFIVTKQGRGYRFIEQVVYAAPIQKQNAGNLPTTSASGASRLVGRNTQIPAALESLTHNALVTLVGPGGVGEDKAGA